MKHSITNKFEEFSSKSCFLVFKTFLNLHLASYSEQLNLSALVETSGETSENDITGKIFRI